MGEVASKEERAELAWATIDFFLRTLEESKLSVSEEVVDQATQEMFAQHAAHLVIHRVEQSHVDPYKLICWFGCALLKTTTEIKGDKDGRCQFRAVAYALIRSLTNLLNLDSEGRVVLPGTTRQLLLQMVTEEKRTNTKHGIWQNGLYAAFHCSLASLRSFDGGRLGEI